MSTLRVYNIENPSTAAGGIGIATDGSVTVGGLQYPTAGPLSNRNLIINGAMQVAQRGTSSTTSGYGSVDRYFVQWNDGTLTHTQTAITSGSPYEEGFRSILRLTNTSATTAAGSIKNCFQYIEAQNLASSGWNYASSSSYVTLSFWVRSSVAQEFYGYLRTFDGTEQGYSFSLGSLSANTWTKVTKIIPGNSNITIDNDNGTGLQVNISPFWGTDFTDSGVSVDTWGAFASGTRTPDYTNTWANTAGATFDLTGVQLEVGSKVTPFEHRSYGDELARCQRYYQKFSFGSYGSFAPVGRKGGAGYTEHDLTIPHGPMRAAPSGTWLGDLVGFRLSRLHDAAATTPTAVTIVGTSNYTLTFRASTSSYSLGDLVAQWSSGNPSLQSYELSAEL
jgi:hypothetical protein